MKPAKAAEPKRNLLDRAIAYVLPRTAHARERARVATQYLRDYEAAASGPRFDNWRTRGNSANTESVRALPIVRDRHRDMRRNNAWIARAIESIVNNTVGYGITSDLQGGSQRLKDLWKEWSETRDCDADGVHDLYGLQGLWMSTIAEGGEVLVRRRRRRPDDDIKVPLQIQVLEGDHLDHSKTQLLPNGGRIIQGVEFDAIGKRVAYWLFRDHPGDVLTQRGESVPVPASEIAHIYRVDRPGQVRGMPWGAAALLHARDLDDYEDAYLLRNKLANCFTAFVEDHTPSYGDTGQAMVNLPMPETLEPGLIAGTPPGKKITFSDPPKTDAYGAYVGRAHLKIAAGYGITYEELTGDYGNVNFSSGRMGWISMHRNIEKWRWTMIIPQGCDVVLGWFLEAAELVGERTEGVTNAWTPPRREMIDPTKEVDSIKEQLRNGLTSLPEVHRELGTSTTKVLADIKWANEQLDSMGITLDCDPRVDKAVKEAAAAAKAKAKTPAKDDPDDEETEEEDD